MIVVDQRERRGKERGRSGGAGEGLNTGCGTAQNEGVDGVCSFVRVDGLEIGAVADDVIFIRDSVSSQHFPRCRSSVSTNTPKRSEMRDERRR